MAIIDGGSNTSNKANVDSNYNLQVRTPMSGVQAGFVTLAAEIDPGSITGSRLVRSLDASYDNRVRASIDTPLFIDRFAGAAQNTALYNYANNNNTFTQSNGWASINATALVAASNYGLLKTYRFFPISPTFGTTFNTYMQLSQPGLTFNTTEWGLGLCATTASPTDGIFFRLTSSNALNCIITSISAGAYAETTVAVPNGANIIGVNTTHRFSIECQADVANFYIDNVLVASVPRPTGGDFTTASAELPIFYRVYTLGGTAAAGQIIRIASHEIQLQDANSTKPWADIQSGMGQNGSQGQTGGTMGSTATWTNATNPTQAAWNNTTTTLMAGFGGFGLNTAPPPAGIATSAGTPTDNLIMAYLVPVGTNAIPGRALYIHGVRLGCINTGAAVATTATAIALYLTYGNTAISQATPEAATTKKPRVVPLGTMYFPVGTPIGGTPQNGDIWMPFTAPIVANPGEYVSLVARFIVGTATASEAFYFTVGFDSYWE